MKDLIKALDKAMENEEVVSRVGKEVQKLLAYCESYSRQGHDGKRQEKTQTVVETPKKK